MRSGAAGGRFASLELIGGGGSAEVWRATDTSGRVVALKMLKPALRRHAGARECIVREHDLLRALAHPHVVVTLGLADHDGDPALVLEHLNGGDLTPLVGADPEHWLRAVGDVGAALVHVHAHGFVHRDVKARNVLFDSRNRARLVDFGSVLPIGAPAAHGGATAAHRPPGRAVGPVAPADDCYAFAALVFELLAARLPYGPSPAPEVLTSPPWPLCPAADPRVRRLADVATAAVASAGDVPGGLSGLLDVIESAAAAYY